MLSEQHDLRGGEPVWLERDYPVPPSDALPETCGIAIIGAGIMGAIVGQRLAEAGHDLLFLDRRPPARGSTAASTAEVMWTMDVPLRDLSRQIGADEAARRWRRVYSAVRGLANRIEALGLTCECIDCPTVYLAGNVLDEASLREECEFHRKAGLPTQFLTAEETAERFCIAPRASLVSTGGFAIDPAALTLEMLERARGHGAHICYPRDVTGVAPDHGGILLTLADGSQVHAGQAIFAGGYERARLFLPAAFSLLSTFVMATPPLEEPPWRERAMIWEASDPYLYIRTCAQGRVIAGGADEQFHDEGRRNAMIESKAGTISARSAKLLGLERPLPIDRRWAATFGSSPDGLPAIGPAANMPAMWLAAGFGGNGIAFAALAAELLSSAIEGQADPDAACFDPYRFNDRENEG
ncbi:MAG TPA: FAD-dependent oxidoreductase [Croceibacterium sp.]|nr:FAD-dependent oxidoreductase [Croceibacterium sp.]